MIRNQQLNLLFLKTGLVTALVAVVVAVKVQFDWAASFASAGLFGLVNWYLLAVILLAWTNGDGGKMMGALCVKLIWLAAYVVIVLPLTGLQVGPFLLGFNMFLIVAVLEAVGSLIVEQQQQTVRGTRPLPRSLKALLTGRPNA
jgi:hypothetical protein